MNKTNLIPEHLHAKLNGKTFMQLNANNTIVDFVWSTQPPSLDVTIEDGVYNIPLSKKILDRYNSGVYTSLADSVLSVVDGEIELTLPKHIVAAAN